MNQRPKIVIKHSRIEINNYEPGDCMRIEQIFSIWDPVYFRSNMCGMEYNEETKKLYLPRGIDISYVERMFSATPMVSKKADPEVKMDPVPIRYLARDETQQKTLRFILGVEEYAYMKAKSQMSVNIGTGKGKTFVTIAAICFSGTRAIVIASSINWLNQWREKIKEYTPLTDKDIYMINGSHTIDKLLHRDPLKYKIFLASHSTIRSYGDRRGWDKVDALFQYLQCGLKVYDEAHLYFDNICKIDFHSNTKRTLYLTATPQRSNQDQDAIYQLYFKNVPSIDLFDEEKDPHTHYIALFYNSHPSPYDVKECRNAYGLDRNRYTNYVVGQENFERLVIVLMEMILNVRGKVLIYIGTNDAILKVKQFIISSFPFLDGHVGVYTSIIEKDRESQKEKKIILSTTKSTGAASDIADLEMTINLAEPFKSSVLAKQTLGRTRADNTFYIDVVDTGFYYTRKYYNEKKKVFSIYAKSCKVIQLSDEELERKSDDIMMHKPYTNPKLKMMCQRVFKN